MKGSPENTQFVENAPQSLSYKICIGFSFCTSIHSPKNFGAEQQSSIEMKQGEDQERKMVTMSA